jgi:hypothetical protein
MLGKRFCVIAAFFSVSTFCAAQSTTDDATKTDPIGYLNRALHEMHGGVLLIPAVGYVIGYCIGRTATNSRLGAVLLSLALTYSAALLTNVPSSYQMFRSKWGAAPWLALLISVPASAYPIFASVQSGFYAFMLMLSFAGAWRGAIS